MIKVASYNMRKGIGTDRRRLPERTLEVLREVDADIIALQEADRRFGARTRIISAHLLDRHSDWQTVPLGIKPMSMGWHGNALLVRKTAQIVDCEVIELPALEPRGAVMADVRANEGIVRVIGVHLDLSGLWRRRQVQAILAHLAASSRDYPTILMGDLNEWNATLGCVKHLARHFTVADTGPSFHASRPIARLDRIMVSPGLRIAGCGVHHSAAARVASDHLPIWAEVERG
ncbi:MAG: endonuclease/exonuclease/phosphatase family protein [Sphingomonas sp.]|jgi:endonuclease/exonuclease/phosphatase family metal-dependent hydrolase